MSDCNPWILINLGANQALVFQPHEDVRQNPVMSARTPSGGSTRMRSLFLRCNHALSLGAAGVGPE